MLPVTCKERLYTQIHTANVVRFNSSYTKTTDTKSLTAAGLSGKLGSLVGMMVPAVVVTKGNPDDFHELGADDPGASVAPKAYAI